MFDVVASTEHGAHGRINPLSFVAFACFNSRMDMGFGGKGALGPALPAPACLLLAACFGSNHETERSKMQRRESCRCAEQIGARYHSERVKSPLSL